MQNRYTGDIGDFGKLGLLRQLAKAGFSIGVNWYLTPDEAHNNDGCHTAYLQKKRFGICDPTLLAELNRIVSANRRTVSQLEQPEILQATFYSPVLDFAGLSKAERQCFRWEWHTQAVQRLQKCDLVFADPDNGLMVPSAAETPKSNKYILPFELAEYYHNGASVVYYQHKARLPDSVYMRQNEQLVTSGAFPGAKGLGLKFKSTSLRYYFFLMQPQHEAAIRKTVSKMLESPWGQYFMLL